MKKRGAQKSKKGGEGPVSGDDSLYVDALQQILTSLNNINKILDLPESGTSANYTMYNNEINSIIEFFRKTYVINKKQGPYDISDDKIYNHITTLFPTTLTLYNQIDRTINECKMKLLRIQRKLSPNNDDIKAPYNMIKYLGDEIKTTGGKSKKVSGKIMVGPKGGRYVIVMKDGKPVKKYITK